MWLLVDALSSFFPFFFVQLCPLQIEWPAVWLAEWSAEWPAVWTAELPGDWPGYWPTEWSQTVLDLQPVRDVEPQCVSTK